VNLEKRATLKKKTFSGYQLPDASQLKNLGKIWKMKHLNSRVYCGTVYPQCFVPYLCRRHAVNKKGQRTREKWRCSLSSMLDTESRVIVRGCVLPTNATGDISGGFPGSPQGQEEIFGC